MAVAVVRADGYEANAGAGGREESGVGVRTPVVRNLEHVGAQVDATGQDARLRLGAEVPGEQHPQPVLREAHDHGEVVGRGGGGGDLRWRGQHLDLGLAHRPPITGHQNRALPTRRPDQPVDRNDPLIRRRQRAGGHHANRSTGERPGEPAHVIGVQVRQQHQRQGVDP